MKKFWGTWVNREFPWVFQIEAVVNGSAANPLAFTFTSASDPRFVNKVITDMNFGGPNPVPEPGTLGLLGLGLAALWMVRRRQN